MGSAADYPCCVLLRPSRSGFRLTLWRKQVVRAFQQFSEFVARLLPGGGDDRLEDLLQHDQVREGTDVLETLARELREPAELFGDTEEAVLALLLAALEQGGGAGRFRRPPTLSRGIGLYLDLT